MGGLSETVQELGSKLREAQPELWAEYQKQAEAFQAWNHQREFERGFLLAAQLMSEVIRRTQES